MSFSTAITDSLHMFTQVLLVPDVIALFLLVAYALYSIGSAIVEKMTERAHLSVKLPELMDEIEASDLTKLPRVIAESGMLKRQRAAALELLAHCELPLDSLTALARRMLDKEHVHYERVVARTDMVAKLGPMLGLMGTLIPLGPGILSLSTGDTAALSQALIIAFDTTVLGIVAAAIAAIVSRIRSLWYEEYASMLETCLTGLLKRVEDEGDKGSELARVAKLSQTLSAEVIAQLPKRQAEKRN